MSSVDWFQFIIHRENARYFNWKWSFLDALSWLQCQNSVIIYKNIKKSKPYIQQSSIQTNSSSQNMTLLKPLCSTWTLEFNSELVPGVWREERITGGCCVLGVLRDPGLIRCKQLYMLRNLRFTSGWIWLQSCLYWVARDTGFYLGIALPYILWRCAPKGNVARLVLCSQDVTFCLKRAHW